ncbi:hypothetical protein B0T20DRAFT_420014 [Sordaria brevicollis]|uniref:Uncharacterized protein n=1 Tax=Sordaria brevicollis TaxID=83679 RepID=A0AAE0U9J4_SORBR|nr:hypothetical protein B0T20DRAFT_420014 [Sordaria brevicollis]
MGHMAKTKRGACVPLELVIVPPLLLISSLPMPLCLWHHPSLAMRGVPGVIVPDPPNGPSSHVVSEGRTVGNMGMIDGRWQDLQQPTEANMGKRDYKACGACGMDRRRSGRFATDY